MSGSRRPNRAAGGRYSAPLVIAATALLAVSMIRHSTQPGSGPPRPAAVQAPDRSRPSHGPAVASRAAPPAALAFATPTQVVIPAIGVAAPMTTVGPEPDGGIGAPPPEDSDLAGWYTGAPTPGERGTAVIDGHVDNMSGPAVFYGLGSLRKGDRVEVSRSDGTTAVFTVYGVELFAKNRFPGDRVYGDTGRPELRVITCGGGFTRRHGYDGNVVVFARLSAVR